MPNIDSGRLHEALTNAEEAFWVEIVKAYPEIQSGDFPPSAHMNLSRALQEATVIWLEGNCPEGVDSDTLIHGALNEKARPKP